MTRNQWITNLQWVRPAQQSRSQKTLARLLDAAEEIIAQQGVEAMTVAAVAKLAGNSVGSVYHHFRDKASLVNATFQRIHREFTATMQDAVDPERWQGARLIEIIQGYLQFSEEVYNNRPAQIRAMFTLSINQPHFHQQMEQINQQLSDALSLLLHQRIDEIQHPDPSLAIGFILDQLRASNMQRHNSERLGQTLSQLTSDEFVAQSLTLCSGYLRIAP